MKQVTINLYSFEELSKEAKEKARENFNNRTEYFWSNDCIKSLEKLAEHFNCKLIDYNIDWSNSNYSNAKFDCENIEFTEKELKQLVLSLGSYNKKTLKGNGDCVLTGVCFDEDGADGVRKAYFSGERNLNELLQSGFSSLLKAGQNDFEYQQSEESFIETCEANEYTFEADGTMNNG